MIIEHRARAFHGFPLSPPPEFGLIFNPGFLTNKTLIYMTFGLLICIEPITTSSDVSNKKRLFDIVSMNADTKS